MNFVFINTICLLFCYFHFMRTYTNKLQTNQTKLCTHARTHFRWTNHTLKEEFIGPIPDPLLNWVTELSNVSANQRWILLRNLKAASVYQFRVSAVNSVGEGPPSEPSNVIRLPQEGSQPPLWCKIQLISEHKMTKILLLSFQFSTIWSASWFRWIGSLVVRNYHTMATTTRRTQVNIGRNLNCY